MQIVRDPLLGVEPPRGAVLTIGNFDGVHIGHQEILRQVKETSRAEETLAAALTFDPHPLKLLQPKDAPRLMTTMDQRLQLLERHGIDVAIVAPFTHRLARMDAADFVQRILADRLAVSHVYIGQNFRFGADRGGDVELLQRMGRQFGFTAHGVAPVVLDGAVVSSTRIRREVARGRIDVVWKLLGRPLFIDGRVFTGERLGRKLGFPTLNTAIENELYPSHGVYITAVYIPSFGRTFPSVTNIGVRPTVYENYSTTVESHLLDFTADVYREKVRIFFFEKIRDEKVFSSPMDLVTQIRRDVASARLWFLNHPLERLDLVTL
ncbi:MAG: bifunctional riboflavin kinase/FAD synthetase [Acidobacteria bacterium]|nr:bifunctional riboflavin kinase/FAD synthetase [Acidobacteriota bacterium]